MESSLKDILRSHSALYPQMELCDYLKLIYQHEFGCGHLITDTADSEAFLRSEYEQACAEKGLPADRPFIEKIGNGLCRVYLNPDRIHPDSLPLINRLFTATANSHHGSMAEFQKKAMLLYDMSAEGLLTLQAEAVRACLEEYFAAGCPAPRHSEAYRENYHPHYRVVKLPYANFLPVFEAVQRLMKVSRPVVIAIDGRCGSGKSLLAKYLAKAFRCSLFHMDDFFLPPQLRTQERLSQPGGNVDYGRFLEEVLLPLSEGQDVTFRPFDCSSLALQMPVHIPASALTIVEGSYSLHPALADYYQLRIFLTCSPAVQQERILKRSGPQMLTRFINEWIPLEENYHRAFNVPEHCDLVVDTSDF